MPVGRPRLNADCATVLKQVKLPEDLAEEFAAKCRELGRPQAAVIRKLIAQWLRQTARVGRLKQRGLIP